MNKAKLKKLAEESAKASVPAKAPAPVKPTDLVKPTPIVVEEKLVRKLYVALVGGSDFVRTQAGEAEVCRQAFHRAKLAAKVWERERAKERSDHEG